MTCLFSGLLALASDNSFAAAVASPYSLGAEVYGLAPYPLSSRGIRAGYALSDTFELEASYVKSDNKLLMIHIEYSEVELRLNGFVSDLLYVGIGVADRRVKLSYDVLLSGTDSSSTSAQIAEAHHGLAVSAHIGTELTFFDYLTVGSDFLSFSKTVHRIEGKDEFPEDADASEENPRDLPFVGSALDGNIQFLRTYLKVRF